MTKHESGDVAGAKAPAQPDRVATLTITIVGALSLLLAWILPWWAMEARAPQYGQRVLIVEVNPSQVKGDVAEIDSLGHYVGIRPINSVANLERKLGPMGLILALAGFVVTPFLRRRWLRLAMVLPTILMPIVFFADLKYWVTKSATDRDPEAALNMTVTTIETRIFGKYEVGQFKVSNSVEGGIYVAGVAAALGFGLVFCVPMAIPGRRKRLAMFACLVLTGAAPSADAAVSIQELIDRAGEGTTVRVPSGIHHEHIIISKSIRLEGDPGAVLDGDNSGTVVKITADGTELKGLTIRNSGDSYTTEDTGIRIDHAKNVSVLDTNVLDTLFGIFLVGGDRCVIEKSRIVGKNLPHERRGDGIRLWYSHGCRILDNRMERSRDVVIWYSNDTRFERNVVVGSRYGLHYMYSDRNEFRHNTFEDNQVGAAIMYSRNLQMTENAFSWSNGVAAYGLLLKDADDIFIRENRFVGNATALFFDNSPQAKGARVQVKKNLIARNDVGVTVEPNTHDIEFSENSFIGNRIQVNVAGTGTAENNRWTVRGLGNYWSDAVVYDRDGDGVSELPYRIEATFEVLADRFPALAFFDGTPAAEALDMAARLFPIFAPRPKLTDSHPLAKPELTDWLRRTAENRASPAVSLAGAGLLITAGLAVGASRKALS